MSAPHATVPTVNVAGPLGRSGACKKTGCPVPQICCQGQSGSETLEICDWYSSARHVEDIRGDYRLEVERALFGTT